MVKLQNFAVARYAKKEYKTFVTSVEEKMETFWSDVDIETKHSEAKKKALDYYGEAQMGDAEIRICISISH